MNEIVIVHDFLGQYGGAERVVEEMCKLYPEAPVYTSYYAPDRTYEYFRTRDVRTSFLDRAPLIGSHYKSYLLLYPRAFAAMRLPECRVVLSSSSSFAKGVKIPAGAVHACYCHSPMRFAWDPERYVEHDSEIGVVGRTVARAVAGRMQRFDLRTNDRVDLFITNSRNIRDRIRRLYHRDALIIYPPVEVDRFTPSPEIDDYYLVLSRLVGYKRVDLAIRACTVTGRRLKVVGEGPERTRLESIAGPTVEFLGRLPDEQMREMLARSRALLFCGDEDFGITPVEAMAAGRPVLAFAAGGALETVLDGETGLFFPEQTPESLAECMDRFEAASFDPARCVAHARGYRPEVFRERLRDAVDALVTGALSVPRAG